MHFKYKLIVDGDRRLWAVEAEMWESKREG